VPADDTGPSPRSALLQALEVRRYGRIALAVGAAVSIGVTGLFLVVIAGGQTDDPLWFYPSLAFVVFVTTAMLAAVVLVARRVLRLVVHPAAIVRRAATGSAVSGMLWLAGTIGLALGPAQPWAALVDVALPWAAFSTPLGLWAVHTRYKRSARLRAGVSIAAVVGLLAALVLADLAAFELVALLPDVGDGVAPRIARLWGLAAAVLIGVQVVLAGLVAFGDGGRARVPLLLAGPAVVGLMAYGLLWPGRLALVCLAGGLGLGWLGVGLSLRRTENADVPTGRSPWPASSD
jgi:hypothetical protein